MLNTAVSDTKKSGLPSRQVILSTAWIFVTVNYLYCDVMTLMDPNLLNQFITGKVGAMQVTQGFLFAAAILMEIPMLMIFLSRVLKYKANRWANIVAGTLMTLVQIASLFAGTPTPFYLFFSVFEITCTAFIVAYAWKWSKPEAFPMNPVLAPNKNGGAA